MTAPELPADDWRLQVYGHGISGNDRRRRPRAADKARVIRKQNNRCLYCDLPIGSLIKRRHTGVILRPNWDHFVPYSYSLLNPGSNWVLACHVCNGIKSGHLFETVEDARAAILTRRLEKGYEDPKVASLRLALPRPRSEAS